MKRELLILLPVAYLRADTDIVCCELLSKNKSIRKKVCNAAYRRTRTPNRAAISAQLGICYWMFVSCSAVRYSAVWPVCYPILTRDLFQYGRTRDIRQGLRCRGRHTGRHRQAEAGRPRLIVPCSSPMLCSDPLTPRSRISRVRIEEGTKCGSTRPPAPGWWVPFQGMRLCTAHELVRGENVTL